eukprot:s1352_g12.t1
MAPLPPWKKVLYLKQPYKDNYVDSSFLDSLILNANVQRYEFRTLCQGALPIIWQLSLVVIFVNVWWRMQRLIWDLQWLLALDIVLFGCLILGWRKEDHKMEDQALWDVLQALKIIFPLWVLAPLLQTLTRSWSDDTIALIASSLLVLHVASYRYKDFGKPPSGLSSKRTSEEEAVCSLPGGPSALNAAILAATILASRLQTAQEVFAFMSFAMEVFALIPRMRITIIGSLQVLVPIYACAVAMLGFSSAACIFVAATVMIGLLSPALFMWAQRYKTEIQGPWDIAHVIPQVNG